jgi:hypothetical protein
MEAQLSRRWSPYPMSRLLGLRTSLDQGPIGGASSEALAWQSDNDWEDLAMSDWVVIATTVVIGVLIQRFVF